MTGLYRAVQGWLYLESIFGSEDILQQMPNEGRKFRAVDATWRRIMAAVRKAPEVLVMCSDDELLKNIIEANKFLEQVWPSCLLTTEYVKMAGLALVEAASQSSWCKEASLWALPSMHILLH